MAGSHSIWSSHLVLGRSGVRSKLRIDLKTTSRLLICWDAPSVEVVLWWRNGPTWLRDIDDNDDDATCVFRMSVLDASDLRQDVASDELDSGRVREDDPAGRR